ncbi:MAG: hypothetical protein ABI349_08275 [Casimicrobiaceae bacterium]
MIRSDRSAFRCSLRPPQQVAAGVLWATDAPSNIKALDVESCRILDMFDCEGGDARIF